MSNDIPRADQIAFHFYTKLFYAVNHARATEDPSSNQKVDKWFNLETPDSDLFTKEAREPYRSISLAPFPGPPTLEIQVLLSIPELTNNQVLVYMSPDSSRVRIEPTPKFILLETWTLGMNLHRPGSASGQHGDTNTDVALPIIYKHGIVLFRSVYSLLRVLPAWKFYKRLKRKISGVNRKGNLGIKLRVRSYGESESDMNILGFNAKLSPTYRSPLPTSIHNFQAIPHLLGSFTLSTTYLTTPNFQLDELESLLSSRFISLDLEGFIPTLDKNRQRDSMSSSSLPNSSGIRSVLSRSPPKPIGRVTSGNGGGGTDNVSVADRFILPSRVASIGAPSLGMTASTGTSALIPPPRPFPSTNPANTSPHITTSPFSIPSQPIPASGLAVNRLRKESLNSSSSSSVSARDAPQGQYPTPYNAGTSSLSSSPVSGALPIRRPTINQVHPFKSNTFSSASGSSPSLSIRQGVGGAVAGGGSPVGLPSSLSGTGPGGVPSTHSRQPSSASPIGNPGRLPPSPMGSGFGAHPSPPAGMSVFSPSSLGDRRPGTSGSGASSEKDRDRRVSVGSGVGVGGLGEGDYDGRVPVPMAVPPRKRYSSSFGHRYVGSGGSGTGVAVGSANSGGAVAGGGNEGKMVGGGGSTPGSGNVSGRNTPASLGAGAGGGLEGKKEGVTSFLTGATTDDDDISIFVQDIDARKPLSGRAKEREQLEQQERLNWQYDRRAHGHDPDPVESPSQMKGKGKETERSRPQQRDDGDGESEMDDRQRQRRLDADVFAHDALYTTTTTTSPPMLDSLDFGIRNPDLISAAESERERVAQMSTSPTRGPMLTSQNEVEERLKKMNEAFFKSLEGISGGSTRRKDRQKDKDKEAASAITTTPSSGSGSENRDRGSTGSSGDGISNTTSRASRGVGLGLGFPSRGSGESDPSRMAYPSYFYDSPTTAPSLGLGLGRGRHASTSSSTLGTSEAGASQGSEEVIGRMELYDEPSKRKRGEYHG